LLVQLGDAVGEPVDVFFDFVAQAVGSGGDQSILFVSEHLNELVTTTS
jgi:hypothetical protein